MNKNIDWKEVEDKIAIICYKFDNLKPWHEDLAQELRIHAYYVSDNYYDLYRKAIDFWRKLQTRQAPEIPYFDLEILGQYTEKEESMHDFDKMVSLINKELNRPGYNKWDNDMLELTRQLFAIILEDIHPEANRVRVPSMNKSQLNHYINKRLNLSWVAEETGIGYKRIVVAMKFLEDTVRGLSAMRKIEIPIEYFKGYYEDK